MIQSGRIQGPDQAMVDYEIRSGVKSTVVFSVEGSATLPAVFLSDLLECINHPYHVDEPQTGWRTLDSFSDEEKRKLRPVAETLAMLDGNAFFGTTAMPGQEWYESYLIQAAALYEGNGGDNGWAGEASFAKSSQPL